jgi:hypothetical protein
MEIRAVRAISTEMFWLDVEYQTSTITCCGTLKLDPHYEVVTDINHSHECHVRLYASAQADFSVV